jgi:hypothetical protein
MLTMYWPCIALLSLYLAFVSLLVIWLVYFFFNLCCCLNCWINVWLIALWLLTVFTNRYSLYFVFRYSEIMIIPTFFPVHAYVFLCWHKVLNFASELILLPWV